MDPVANLAEQRRVAASIIRALEALAGRRADDDLTNDEEIEALDAIAGEGARLAELVNALDEWRKLGGFDPYVGEDD